MMIDAHQHYWNPARGDYGWMPKGDATLDRAYGPDDLAPALAEHGIGGTVLVQAAPSVEETEYMLGIADATPSVLAVVGWVDFEDHSQRATLERLSGHPKFRGVRPMIQDIEDVDWMLREDVAWGYRAVTDLDLTFDALGYPVHLPNFHALLRRFPDMRAVVDHGMKPRIRDAMGGRDAFADWAAGMTAMARDTGAFCKLSGLATEANQGWTLDDLRPFAEHILHAFGPSRVMWGSDWPVVRLRGEYADWRGAAEKLCAGLSEGERADVFGGTARRFYRL